jgi:hypothetical protein
MPLDDEDEAMAATMTGSPSATSMPLPLREEFGREERPAS